MPACAADSCARGIAVPLPPRQDWLITVFRGVDAAQSNVTAADTWLGAMDVAARNLGLTVQCK